MTTLYKPVLIESAEQAEALPVGTVAIESGEQGQAVGASIRVQGGWHCTGYCLDFGGSETLKHSDMVGDTALAPIEAEEQRITSKLLKHPPSLDDLRAFQAGETPADRTRLVTPWEAIR